MLRGILFFIDHVVVVVIVINDVNVIVVIVIVLVLVERCLIVGICVFAGDFNIFVKLFKSRTCDELVECGWFFFSVDEENDEKCYDGRDEEEEILLAFVEFGWDLMRYFIKQYVHEDV